MTILNRTFGNFPIVQRTIFLHSILSFLKHYYYIFWYNEFNNLKNIHGEEKMDELKFLMYQVDNNNEYINAVIKDEMIWLTQKSMV